MTVQLTQIKMAAAANLARGDISCAGNTFSVEQH